MLMLMRDEDNTPASATTMAAREATMSRSNLKRVQVAMMANL
jgi:hypothetical protein